MPGERVSMRKIREVLRLRFAQGLSQRAIGDQPGSEHRGREQLPGPRPDGRSGLAVGGRVQRRGTRDIIISAATGIGGGTAAGSGLGGGTSRVAAAERDAGAALGRISRRDRRPGWLRLLLVLRFVSRMGQTAEADAAPGAYGGRTGVRRLLRPHHGGDRRGDRRNTPRRDLRRRARRLQLHLRGSGLVASRCRTGSACT